MLIVGANLTQDRVLRLPELVPGAVVRASEVDVAPGGKPVNVARVARLLGAEPTLVANLPGHLGALLGEELAAAGVDVVAVRTAGEARAATIVAEPTGRITVINEPGPPLQGEDLDAFRTAFADALHRIRPRVVVVAGSLPPGTPPGLYGELVMLAHDHGSFAIVDASGAALASALEARADLVKPNLAEAEAVVSAGGEDRPPPTELVDDSSPEVRTRCVAAAEDLVARGARAAAVSGGARGVALHAAGRASWFVAPRVDAVNAVGAGDALVAGTAVALERGDDLETSIGFGVATAADSVRHAMPGDVDAGEVAALRRRMEAAS